MRPDMFKVIVERQRTPRGPSVGSAYPRGSLEARWAPNLDDSPRIEAMGRSYDSKYLNENLAPLRRYLRSNVGRPWNKVRSEISEHLSVKNAVQKHVIDHLKDYVRERAWFEGHVLYAANRWGMSEPLHSVGERIRFYVCPRSGILRKAPSVAREKSRRRPLLDPDRIVFGKDRELRCIDGIWYALTFAPIPRKASEVRDCYDALVNGFVDPSRASFALNPIWWSGRYVVKKIQVNSRVIAKHGLSRSS